MRGFNSTHVLLDEARELSPGTGPGPPERPDDEQNRQDQALPHQARPR